MPEQKKYTGRGGYHGGGRKTLDPTGKRKEFKTVSISGTPEEMEALKQKAKAAGQTVSRFVLDNLI